MTSKRVAVIGGGITGLSAAYYVQQESLRQGMDVKVTIIEKSSSLGGKIQTLYRDGFVIEKGPDSFLARKLPIIELSRELGLEKQLTATNSKAKKTYILKNGTFHRMPPGLVLGIPTEMIPFLKSGLVSPLGKARAVMDLMLPPKRNTNDESLGAFLQRRLGKEIVSYIAEPLLSGIYAGDMYGLSLQATFPQFQEQEQKHGSLIRGMTNNRKAAPAASQTIPEAVRHSTFLTYTKGLNVLVEALEAKLQQEQLLLGQELTTLHKEGETFHLQLDDGSIIESDAVITTLPTFMLDKLLPNIPEIDQLAQMPYASVANVIMAFDEQEVKHSLDGSGFLVPAREGRQITACTWTSSKWLHSAPQGKVLIRCYIGRLGDDRWRKLADSELVQIARKDLKELMGIEADPLFTEVTRLERSMPQYPVNHLSMIRDARSAVTVAYPGLFLSGSGFEGVGLPDCIRQGKTAAEQTIEYILNKQ